MSYSLVSPVVLFGTLIRQDSDGRFCVNDLHRASGGHKRHSPAYWMQNQQTQELIAELMKEVPVTGMPVTEQNHPVMVVQGGDPARQGTFVVREMVYAYAMWISPEFHIQVIRTFDSVATGQHPAPVSDPRALAPLLLKADLEVSALLGIPLHLAQVEAVKVVMHETGIDYLPRLALAPAQSNIQEDNLMLEPADLAKRLGIKNGEEVNRWLARMGLQEKSGNSWVPTAKAEGKCAQHQWSTKYKSGYNLKWSVAFIQSFLPEDWKITKDA